MCIKGFKMNDAHGSSWSKSQNMFFLSLLMTWEYFSAALPKAPDAQVSPFSTDYTQVKCSTFFFVCKCTEKMFIFAMKALTALITYLCLVAHSSNGSVSQLCSLEMKGQVIRFSQSPCITATAMVCQFSTVVCSHRAKQLRRKDKPVCHSLTIRLTRPGRAPPAYPFTQVLHILHRLLREAYQRQSEISALAASETFTQRRVWRICAGFPHSKGVNGESVLKQWGIFPFGLHEVFDFTQKWDKTLQNSSPAELSDFCV